MKHDKFDLDKELRAGRSQPRAEFAHALADQVRSTRAAQRSPLGRLGLALALSGLIVVALASFGGVGYASSASSHATKKPTVAKHVWIVNKPRSAAAAQYCPENPEDCDNTENTVTPQTKDPTTPQSQTGGTTAAGGTTAGGTAGTVAAAAPKAKAAQLPFTGLALWVPLSIGCLLIAFGLVLRTRGRRRDAAH